MRLGLKVTMAVMALLLSGCEMKLRRAKTPPAPQPTIAKEEPPPAPEPSEPLSIPQTQVKLPRPQPIDPQALATPPTPPSETAALHPARHAKKTGPQPAAASPAKPEPVETTETPPPTAEPPRPSIEPVLPADRRRQLQEDVASRLREVDQKLTRLAALRLSDPEKASVERIRSFAKLSQDALYRGDLQQASSLAERALLAAQELLRDR